MQAKSTVNSFKVINHPLVQHKLTSSGTDFDFDSL
jgi:hypothetical protein